MKIEKYIEKELFKTENDKYYGIKLSYERFKKIIKEFVKSKDGEEK